MNSSVLNQERKMLTVGKNTIGSDYVVGDPHGCFTSLRKLLKEVNFNTQTDRLFCTGDWVDRGPDSLEVLEWLAQPWVWSVRGNHEDMALETENVAWIASHLQHGGVWFRSLADEDALRYTTVFSSLPWALEIQTDVGMVGVVHAEVPNDDWNAFKEILKEPPSYFQDRCAEKALWGRSIIKNPGQYQGVVGIDRVCVGHTPVTQPIMLANVIYLDTGVVYGDRLSLLCIQGARAGEFVSVEGEMQYWCRG